MALSIYREARLWMSTDRKSGSVTRVKPTYLTESVNRNALYNSIWACRGTQAGWYLRVLSNSGDHSRNTRILRGETGVANYSSPWTDLNWNVSCVQDPSEKHECKLVLVLVFTRELPRPVSNGGVCIFSAECHWWEPVVDAEKELGKAVKTWMLMGNSHSMKVPC